LLLHFLLSYNIELPSLRTYYSEVKRQSLGDHFGLDKASHKDLEIGIKDNKNKASHKNLEISIKDNED